MENRPQVEGQGTPLTDRLNETEAGRQRIAKNAADQAARYQQIRQEHDQKVADSQK